MRSLDPLIAKFKEVKEELSKEYTPLSTTDSAQRKQIFGAIPPKPPKPEVSPTMAARPRAMNSPKAVPMVESGRKATYVHPSTQDSTVRSKIFASVKKDEDVEKAASLPPRTVGNAGAEAAHAQRGISMAPKVLAPHKNTLPSPQEHAARANMYADFMPGVKKNTNMSAESSPNLMMSEKLTCSENGQWKLASEENENKSKC